MFFSLFSRLGAKLTADFKPVASTEASVLSDVAPTPVDKKTVGTATPSSSSKRPDRVGVDFINNELFKRRVSSLTN